jgi:hypothetical protein
MNRFRLQLDIDDDSLPDNNALIASTLHIFETVLTAIRRGERGGHLTDHEAN